MKPVMRGTLLFLAAVVLIGSAAGCARLCSYCPYQKKKAKRYGSVIGVRAEKLEEYKNLHAAVWPGVLKMIDECNIRNYSIYLGQLDDGNYYLFSYFEYTGDDFEADMKKMAADPMTQKWWDVCEPCQIPQKNRAEGEWWMTMEEVFHFK